MEEVLSSGFPFPPLLGSGSFRPHFTEVVGRVSFSGTLQGFSVGGGEVGITRILSKGFPPFLCFGFGHF